MNDDHIELILTLIISSIDRWSESCEAGTCGTARLSRLFGITKTRKLSAYKLKHEKK